MNKKEFLSKLESKLKILKKEEIEDILSEYESNIDEKIKTGKSEEDAIKDFGNIDDLVKEILSAYKIADDYEGNQSFDKTISDFVSKTAKSIKDVFTSISKENTDTILEIIFEVFVLLIIIAILRLPFFILRELGASILSIFPNPLDRIFIYIWRFLIEIAYLIASVSFFVSNFRNRKFKNDQKKGKKQRHKTTINEEKSTEKVIIEETDEEQSEPYRGHKSVNIIKELFVLILKVFTVIWLIPFFGIGIGIMIVLGILIGLLVNGVIFIGPALIILGSAFILFSFIGFVINLVFGQRRGK